METKGDLGPRRTILFRGTVNSWCGLRTETVPKGHYIEKELRNDSRRRVRSASVSSERWESGWDYVSEIHVGVHPLCLSSEFRPSHP